MPVTDAKNSRWALVVHGGAGTMSRGSLSDAEDADYRSGVRAALEAGAAVLKAGGTALDAVEASVRVLEDDPLFNAGHGAVFTAEGRNELDAAIMDGSDRRAGSVAGVTRSRNPISLARAVMERSDHVLLAREGADTFAVEHGLEQVDPDYFRTDERWRQLQERKARGPDAMFDANLKYGTVGAVACDSHGHVAAGTSTGGLTGKRWGRIGDSPLIGAGTYADDRAGAVSATGSGEYFIRVAAAHEIGARVRLSGETLQDAADAVVQDELKVMGGDGGVIAVSPDGTMAWSFNTSGMYRGRVSADSDPVTAIYDDEI
ncbi:isoaspartyl peptidase/L-asparaginase family protein [Glacieibacterium sp.]|uniref:isoaspartyl peptidase/L-asparaginase family protein n=1 Tax=Glacieibacterium sp. TaxID=2860237 RepID=UPI003B0097D9